MSSDPTTVPLHVVVVGGGIAAAEAVLALNAFAADRVRLTLLARDRDFLLRPLAVAQPFSRGHVGELGLGAFMTEHGGGFRQATVSEVDTERRLVRCEDGPDEPYDVLILAPGAARTAPFEHALVFGERPIELTGILADLEEGYSRSAAFIVPAGCTWPLPVYELALMTAEQVWGQNMDRVAIHLLTPELAPLDIFGEDASLAVAALLDAAKVTLHRGVHARAVSGGWVSTGVSPDLHVDRIVTVPLLHGHRIDGIPSDDLGFIAVDEHGQVTGIEDVYALGDAADHAIKQGGLACQQADVSAAHIAARVGLPVDPPVSAPVLRGRLLTGRHDLFVSHGLENGADDHSGQPLWWPPSKVSGRFLSPYLTDRGFEHLALSPPPAGPGVDVHVPLTYRERHAENILGLDPLGPIGATR